MELFVLYKNPFLYRKKPPQQNKIPQKNLVKNHRRKGTDRVKKRRE